MKQKIKKPMNIVYGDVVKDEEVTPVEVVTPPPEPKPVEPKPEHES